MTHRKIAFWFSGAVLLVILAWPHLFLKAQIPVDANVLRVLFPNQRFLGMHPVTFTQWPLWNPYRNMGEPFLADPITLAAYPLNWFLARVPSMLFFFRSWVLIHTLLAGAFMAQWVYKRTMSLPAAVGAALVSMLNGFFMSRITLAHHFASAAYVPMILYFFDEERTVPFAIGLALQWVAGFPSFSYITGMLLVLWALSEGNSKRKVLFQGALVAGGLCAYQLFPFLEYLGHATRGLILDPAMAFSNAEPWQQWLKILFVPHWFLWHPQLTGDQAVVSFYVGPVVLLLALWGACSKSPRSWFMVVACALSAALSLGALLPGYSHVIFLRVMRFPANWLLITSVSISYLCGMGLARIRSVRRAWCLVGLIAIDLISFAYYVRVPWFEPDYLTMPPPLAVHLKSVAAVSRLYHPPQVTDHLADQPLRTMQDYVFMKQALMPSYGMAFGFHEVSSYDTLMLGRAARYQARLASEGPGSPLQMWAGISTVITRSPGSDPWGPTNLQEISLPLYNPPVFWVHDSAAARIDLSHREPGLMQATVFSKESNELVFSEVSYPGWMVAVDQQKTPLKLFEETFLSVQVPPGHHDILMTYRPWSFWIGFWLSLGMLVFLGFRAFSRLHNPSQT